MLCIHRPNFKSPQKYLLFEDDKRYKGGMIELADGYEFKAFQYVEHALIKGYVDKNKYVIISVYDTCWVGKNTWVCREFIKENIPIFIYR